MKILVINGVNMDMLGKRDKNVYGQLTLKQLNAKVRRYAAQKGAKAVFFQSGSEDKLCRKICKNTADAVILHAGAYSHYSYALRDAVECCGKPVAEAHLSDISNREDFRKTRVLDGVVVAAFWGEKEASYFKAVDRLIAGYKVDGGKNEK